MGLNYTLNTKTEYNFHKQAHHHHRHRNRNHYEECDAPHKRASMAGHIYSLTGLFGMMTTDSNNPPKTAATHFNQVNGFKQIRKLRMKKKQQQQKENTLTITSTKRR